MSARLQIQLLLLGWAVNGVVNAVEYQDFAPVLDVEPVTEIHYEPVTHRVCTEPDESLRDFNEIADNIGGDIRRQAHLWEQQQHCKTVTEQLARQRVSRYRVTYRYGGETNTIHLSYDPGERMPVKVKLSPIP
jgi:hypothetical protein